jgi:RNA polymerase sigma-70 factor (ECF subfamily)
MKSIKNKQKSNEKFEELIKPHINKIYKFLCAYTRDFALAQDLLQDCLIKAYLNMDKLRDDKKITSWLYKIAQNSAIDYFKKNKTQTELYEHLTADSNAYAEADAKHDISFYLMCLENQDREILILKDMLGYSYSEIAQILEISLSNVGVRLYRARDKFKEIICRAEYLPKEEVL